MCILYAIRGNTVAELNNHYWQVPPFDNGVICQFTGNLLSMQKLAARDFEDLLQISTPQYLRCDDLYCTHSALYQYLRVYCHTALKEFIKEYEVLYYQWNASCIHFVCHSVHLLMHIAPKTIHAGSLTCYTQWTMETAIGNLGKEIHQDKDPYRNLKECGVICAQINSLMAMYPKLDINYGTCNLPIHAHGFPDGYAFLPQRHDSTPKPMAQLEYNALVEYWEQEGWSNQSYWPNTIVCWAQLQLPNGQQAHSIWSKSNLQVFPLANVRLALKWVTYSSRNILWKPF